MPFQAAGFGRAGTEGSVIPSCKVARCKERRHAARNANEPDNW